MKNGLLIVLLIFYFPGFSQMLEKNNVVAEFNIGYPNLIPLLMDGGSLVHSGPGVLENEARSYGQFIAKGEFMMTDYIGFTTAINYSFFSTHELVNYNTWNSATQQYETNTYFYDSKIHRLRVTFGMNFHVLRARQLDSYFGIQAGGKKAWLNYSTNDPAILSDPSDFIIPHALRVHYGLRFFLTEYFAINTEIGLGGPLFSFGATYKF